MCDSTNRTKRSDGIASRVFKIIHSSSSRRPAWVTFQQIQKYESAKNAVAPGRLRQMCEFLGVAPAEMFGNQPKIDGEPILEMTRWSYQMLIALNKIRSESLRRSIGALIEEMVGSQ